MSDPLDALRRLGEKNKQAVEASRQELADTIRQHLSEQDFGAAMACFDRAINTLRGTPAQREAVLGTLEAVGTRVQKGDGFRRLKRPSSRRRQRPEE